MAISDKYRELKDTSFCTLLHSAGHMLDYDEDAKDIFRACVITFLRHHGVSEIRVRQEDIDYEKAHAAGIIKDREVFKELR